jgi:folate-binding protein YgfZ
MRTITAGGRLSWPRQYDTVPCPKAQPQRPVNDTFLAFLATRGGTVADGGVRDFGDPGAEIAATRSGDVVACLAQFGILAFDGEDARDFLHGQLSCDVEGLAEDGAAYGTYCTPKGRVLANVLLWREPEGLRMLLPRSILPGIARQLQRYVLRSRVTIGERTDGLALLGASGPGAERATAALVGTSPEAPLRSVRREGVAAIALANERFLVVAPNVAAPRAWDHLAGSLRPVGTACWAWLEIASGFPWITDATQDQFIPQMANLELLGGVSFRKGCYPGQEIVARTQHLGTPKRRLYLAHVPADGAPAPGQALYGSDLGDQSAGTVVNAAPAPGGGFDVLAVVQTAAASGDKVRLGSPSGVALEFRSLPYAVP